MKTVPLLITGSPIEIVDSFEFLGTVTYSGLGWETEQQLHPKEGAAENILPPAAEVWATVSK